MTISFGIQAGCLNEVEVKLKDSKGREFKFKSYMGDAGSRELAVDHLRNEALGGIKLDDDYKSEQL